MKIGKILMLLIILENFITGEENMSSIKKAFEIPVTSSGLTYQDAIKRDSNGNLRRENAIQKNKMEEKRQMTQEEIDKINQKTQQTDQAINDILALKKNK